MSSINDKLERVRKPRVHIKYEVETEGAEVSKEIPFTVGAIGDYAGTHPGAKQKSVKDRKFVNIDQDNFSSVMGKIKPGVKVRVDNVLDDSKTEIGAHLVFESMEDFEPDAIIEQVKPLKELKAIRDQLTELLTKTDVSDDLEELLENILKNPEKLNELAGQLKTADEDKGE
jgi:type VI secretion system protein ImpB